MQNKRKHAKIINNFLCDMSESAFVVMEMLNSNLKDKIMRDDKRLNFMRDFIASVK